MRILHVTNIISHHQLPLARDLARLVGTSSFRFATTQHPSSERQALGWKCEEKEPWILRPAEIARDKEQFVRWWDQADVVICTERLLKEMKHRLVNGKLTFYMSERWWKPSIGMFRLLHPRFASMAAKFSGLAKSRYFHFMPIGGYAASDIKRLAAFPNRTWQWGYFTELPDPLPEINPRKEHLRIIWGGRMLPWKQVDTLIRAFSILCRRGAKATLTIIGDGPCRSKLEQLVEHLDISDRVTLLKSMPPSEVRNWMRRSQVYVLPSNGYEGWGAVINEAMSEGNTVVASEAAGSAKALIQHGENGFLFKPGDYQGLADLLSRLNADDELRVRLAKAGQRTIADIWSPKVAAERFLSVCDALLMGSSPPKFSHGPMTLVSPAETLRSGVLKEF